MKKVTIALTTVLLTVLLTASTFADNRIKLKCCEDYQKFEANLLVGLTEDNAGLKLSSAYYLGEIKSEKAVLPLIKLLRDSEDENLRIMAALSLIKIGNEKGIFMVQREAIFNDFDRVRELCQKFYYSYLTQDSNMEDYAEPNAFALK